VGEMRQGRESGCERGSKESWERGGATWLAFSTCVHARVSGGCGEYGAGRAGPWRKGTGTRSELVTTLTR
jgi:hypothetical protein